MDYATIVYGALRDSIWMRFYEGIDDGPDEARAIVLDQSGNVLVTGMIWAGENCYDYATVKYDSMGNQLWIRPYNGPSDSADGAWDIAVDDSSYVYVTGESYDYVTGWDYLTIKYSSNGLSVWTRRYDGGGHEKARALTVDGSGNVYVTGTGGTVKYDANGTQQWAGEGTRSAVVVDEYGNVYATGLYSTTKYDPEGNEQWTGAWGGADITMDATGGIYICAGGPDFVAVKYDSEGDTVWLRKYIGPLSDLPHAITVNQSGNIYVTGASYDAQGRYNYLTIAYDKDGNQLWLESYNGPGWRDDEAYAIATDNAGNVYITGKTRSLLADDFTTIKYVQYGVRGDVNGNGLVEPGDVVFLVNYLFKGGAAPDPYSCGDCDCDGEVGPGDVVYLINYLFRGGPVPSC